MIQKHRIYTNIGKDQKINVEILNTYDLMEILSLKFSQKDIFPSGSCSEYGVVVGRISANNGFGIPNAKISIFVPQTDLDVNDPVISKLYPYTTVSDKDENGYRYNLLPARQQHSGHVPTGTFFDQEDILTREEVLEVFESYYKYTVKTNSAGDYMIWGVPIGSQILHIDIDLSDIGCFSLRPYDFLRKGVGIDEFERYYAFKSSSDIDGLPQIVSYDQTVNVYPFWGNEELCEIGITRSDFDLSSLGIKIEPISLILLSSVTDDNSDAVKRNGKIRKNTGYKCNLQTSTGKVECVRYTGKKVLASDGITKYPELEYLNITEVIDQDGIMMGILPMNLDYYYTNEFGEIEVTNDTNKGIATSVVARFRFSLDFDGRKTTAAKYLVPNIREFNPNSDGTSHGHSDNIEYNDGMLATYQFSDVFEDYITIIPPITGLTSSTNYGMAEKANKADLMLGTNNDNIPEDYFYKFIYGKVYAVSSFQGSHFEGTRRDAFLGIKQIRPTADEDCTSKANYFPTNFGYRNRTKFSLIISQVLLFIQYIFAVINVKVAELIGKFLYTVSRFFYNLVIWKWRPFRGLSQRLEDLAYRIQDRFTQQLPLTIYPDCEECTTTDDAVISDTSFADTYCRVAEVKFKIEPIEVDYEWITLTMGVRLVSNSSADMRNLSTDPSFFSGGTTNNIFDGEYARDEEGLCSGSTIITYSSASPQLDDLHTYATVIEGEGSGPRYVAEGYGWITPEGDPQTTNVSEFMVFFLEDIQFDDIIITNNGANKEIVFSLEKFNELTGIDYGVNNTENPIIDTDSYIVLRIYDRGILKEAQVTGSTVYNIEEGCDKYDKTYNEGIVYAYLWATGQTYENSYQPVTPPKTLPATYTPDCPGFMESKTQPAYPYIYLLATIIAKPVGVLRMPYRKNFSKIGRAIYDRKTKSGYSEFRDGIFTIIPVIRGKSNNFIAIQEWYRRKRVGLFFCGGVLNYSFIDNWLNGILYFFKFDKRVRWDNEGEYDLNQRRTRYPRELVFYNILDKNFYYRCTPYNLSSGFIGQFYKDETVEILHPTTFYDVGVRDEFLSEICYDPMVDPACSVIRDIGPTSYQDAANIIEYAINYRMDITSSKFDVDDFFTGQPVTQIKTRIKVLDGDITQLMSINCEAGIEAFDLDGPHYNMYNGELMDPEDPRFGIYFKNSSNEFAPISIDLKLDPNGALIRSCLNNRLGDYSQVVPFYLWNKQQEGFGRYGDYSDSQTWDKSAVASMKFQRLFSISGVTATSTNYLMPDGEEEYLLKPMTITHNTFAFTGDTEDMLERFEVISYETPNISENGALEYIEGDLWLYVPPTSGTTKDPQGGIIYVVVNKTWVEQPDPYIDGYREMFIPQTALNYYGELNNAKQVLSTPFLFYFGLRPEKTALDLLIKYFGPKGAFTTPTPIPLTEITPIPTPSLSPSVTPSISLTPGLSPSPTRTPTPTPSAFLGYPTIYTSNQSYDNLYRIEDVSVVSTSLSLPGLPYVAGGNGSTQSPYGTGSYTMLITILGSGSIPSYLHIRDSNGVDHCRPVPPYGGMLHMGYDDPIVMNTSVDVYVELNNFEC